MQLLETLTQQHEAHMLRDLLKARGIDCDVVGAREYASIILGGTTGRFRLMVADGDLENARAILREIRFRNSDGPAPQHDPFRRAVFFAFAAVLILPVIFNYSSLNFGWKYWQQSPKDFKAQMKFLLIILLQIPTIVLSVYLYEKITTVGLGLGLNLSP